MPRNPPARDLETSIADVATESRCFGLQARHVMNVIDRHLSGSVRSSQKRMETDAGTSTRRKRGCASADRSPDHRGCMPRRVKPTLVGDAGLLGFPLAYTTTAPGADGKPVIVMQMEVTEFEVTNLNASLFDIPEGMTAATNGRELAKAISDANEAKLAVRAPASTAPAKKSGVIRVGVPELANKTTQSVDTRALRTQLIAELSEQKMEGIPLAAAPQEELNAYAKDLGCDYLLVAQITELKASKPGRLGRMIKATAGEATNKDVTEAKLTLQLVGRPRSRDSRNQAETTGLGITTVCASPRLTAMLYLRIASPLGASTRCK